MSDVFDTKDEADREELLALLQETNAAPDFQAGLTLEEKIEIEARRGLLKARERVERIIKNDTI